MYHEIKIGESAVAEYWDAQSQIMPTIRRESDAVYSCTGPSPNRGTWVSRRGWSARDAFNAWRERVTEADRDAARPEERRGASLLPELHAALERYGALAGGEDSPVYRVLGGTIERREWAKGATDCEEMFADQFFRRVTDADAAYEIQRLGWLFREAAADSGTLADFYGVLYGVLVMKLHAHRDGFDRYVTESAARPRQERGIVTRYSDGWKVLYNPSSPTPFTVDYDRKRGRCDDAMERTNAALAKLYREWKGEKPRGAVNIQAATSVQASP